MQEKERLELQVMFLREQGNRLRAEGMLNQINLERLEKQLKELNDAETSESTG